ncbi:MAG: signal peptidase II [Longimicrobiales bacterium]
MPRPWYRWFGWITVFVILADWVSKFMILNWITLYERVAVLEGWLYLVRLKNQGVAFGILNDLSTMWRTPLVIGAACIAVIMLAYVARTVPNARAQSGVALVVGGALGNLGDRVVNGGVTDFVWVSFIPYVFNVADAAICLGAILLATSMAPPARARQPAG